MSDEREVRLELLIGHLSDLLAPSRELAGALRLQANASVTTRSKLELLIQMTGLLWQHLGEVRDEVRTALGEQQ